MAPDDFPESWDERSTLLAMWRYTREVAAGKCAELADRHVAAAPLSTSPRTTIGGVLNHLRWVEHWWVEVVALGREERAPWTDDDPDAEWRIGAERPLQQTLSEWCAQADALTAEMARWDLDARVAHWEGKREAPTLRWVVLHLVEENARHNGHLDVLRELADGRTGD